MFSRTFIVKNISNSLTYTVASSFVCTSLLAVTTVVGLLETLTVSNSAEFRSFAQHVHWCSGIYKEFSFHHTSFFYWETPNFGRWEKSSFAFSLSFGTLLSILHASPRAQRSCLSVSFWDRSCVQTALMRIFDLNHSERWTLLSRMFAWRSAAFEKCTRRIGPKTYELFRQSVVDFGGSISWNTQPNCRVLFSIATALLSPFFSDFLLGCSSTWRCA